MSHITEYEPRGARRARLTRTEYRCAQLAGQGLLSKEIAEELGCKYGTVKAHLYSACQKLGVHSRFVLSMQLRDGLPERFMPRDLTERQREAVEAIASGDPYTVVAARLGISLYMLKGRLSAVTKKVGMAPRKMRLLLLDQPTQGEAMFYIKVGWHDGQGRRREQHADLGHGPTSEEVCNHGAALYRLLIEEIATAPITRGEANEQEAR